MPHRTIRGILQYTSDKPERKGQERGREHFTMTIHGDGRRTLRALSEIDDPPPVLRDVTLSLGSDWKPIDCFVRLTVGDRFMGSSWFRFTKDLVECEGYTAQEGRISQRVPLDAPLGMFGTHPIAADAWLTNVANLDKGPHWQLYENLWLCSLDHRGATGPMLMRHPLGLRLAFVGRERIEVKAGSFDALHFRFGENSDVEPTDTRNEPGKHPPYELWCTADGDYVFLKAFVTGYMMTAYELVSLERA
jgi:hypothetical protein